MANTTFQFFWQDQTVGRQFRTGVSLHSHTMFSEESLEQISSHLARVPYLGSSIAQNNCFDVSRGYWTPPLPPRRAHRLEEKQIHRALELPALVSLTDHDDIRAGALLCVLGCSCPSPISLEWTVPFASGVFHVGVHNLPPSSASEIMAELRDFTAGPDDGKLGIILERLHAHPHVLLVLNHPLWDEAGTVSHPIALNTFLEQYGRWVHGLELNGLRPWCENRKVIQLGAALRLPTVSGGDRHGLEPNAVLNLSRAINFSDFVYEVRYERKSHIVIMPQYREPHALRIMRMIVDVLADYPQIPGRIAWHERVFVRDTQTGSLVPFSSLGRRVRGWSTLLRLLVRAVRIFQYGSLRWALRLAPLGVRQI